VALLCRHGLANEPALLEALAADGVLHLSGSYAALPATGDTYAERVASYARPVDCWTAPNVVTSCHTHTPHPSKWNCPGSTPELFGQMLSKAADVACAGVPAPDQQGSPPIVTCYNVAEWAEGGPGLQPNMRDRFGYLQAVRDVVED